MPDAFSVEFTGERVIPGEVDDNLFNEHLARYRFVAHLVREFGLKGLFLDAGCGTGYGSAEIAKAGMNVLGIDISPDAVAYARRRYSSIPDLRFAQASCIRLPVRDGAFHWIAAFEVIEHLSEWRDFLAEVRRVLDPDGLFLVSTPNRLYYAESRQNAGPNPFHVHEFTAEEFDSELSSVFPHVKVLEQNHVEGIAFSGTGAHGAALEIGDHVDDPSRAHFFLAICGERPLPEIPRFVFIPETGNILQVREHHIALLEQSIERDKIQRARMMERVREMEMEVEEHNRWALQANREAERTAQIVVGLQEELRKSNEWAQARDAEAVAYGERIVQLQNEVAQAIDWAKSRDAEIARCGERIIQLQDELEREQKNGMAAIQSLEAEYEASRAGYEAAIEQWRKEKLASDEWAVDTGRERDGAQVELEAVRKRIASLETDLAEARASMGNIARSRWVRLGRTFGVGPEINQT